MRKLTLFSAVLLLISNICFSQEYLGVDSLVQELHQVTQEYKALSNQVRQLSKDNIVQNQQIKGLISSETLYISKIDSLQNEIVALAQLQDKDRTSFLKGIEESNISMTAKYKKLDGRTLWGGIIFLFAILGFTSYLFFRRRKNALSISEVRKAQDILQTTQIKLQEDSLKLDNQMLALVEQQMKTASQEVVAETDHSLTLKVADEIVRIEMNLSRMDPSVRGYKQLSKAVERIKNNFLANGYEIVDMLGKPYNDGMKLVADFVPDDTLQEGEQVITGITKPQINYNGQMIQSAQVTVSQNL